MNRVCCAPFLFLLLTSAQLAQAQSPDKPYFEARTRQADYHGPGRAAPAPENLTEIRLAYFGPADPHDPEGGPVWTAAQLAIERANREGGFQGIPFRLIPIWSEDPWGSGVSELARSIYTDDVWAIIGSIDGASTHLAEQVVTKARLTLINPISTDNTVNLANVPWMFSCLPGEHLQAPVLANGIAEFSGGSAVTLVSATDHDSRIFVKELRGHLAAAGIVLAHHFELDGQQKDYSAVVDQVVAVQPKVVVVVASALVSAHLIKRLRTSQFPGKVFGGPNIGRTEFLKEAGSAAAGVTFPVLVRLRNTDTFREAYQSRAGNPPDYRAFQTYDAVTLLIGAISRAGLNRARIRDAVRDLSPWEGLSGPLIWDALGQNRRPVTLATIGDGQTPEMR